MIRLIFDYKEQPLIDIQTLWTSSEAENEATEQKEMTDAPAEKAEAPKE